MELLEKHFDTALAAPDGIKKLRELILTLAVSGRLVPQNPSDQPASELLLEISEEKQQLIRDKKLKKFKPLPELEPTTVPYSIPDNWSWVRLEEITSKITDGDHKTPPRIPSGKRLLSAKNVRDGFLRFENCDCISEEDYLKSRERCCPEYQDLLIVSVGGTIGRSSLVPEDSDFALVRSVALIKPLKVSSSYLKYAMDSTLLQTSIHSKKRGGAQPCLYLSEIKKFFLSIPPLAEQHRIVAKIDQLMARCDELEKLRESRDRLQIKVNMAACDRLLNAPDTNTFTQSWQFITKHFSELYSVKENVAQLRKAILKIAIVGKLSSQKASDQPISELIEQIEEKKKYLALGRTGKKLKRLKDIRTEDVPCVLPRAWKWVRLGSLIELVSGQHLRPNEYNQDGIGFSYYTGPADFGDESPTPTRWTTVDRSIAIEGDILLTVKGAGVGKTNILAEEKAAISRQLMALRVILIDKDYLLYFLKTIFDELQGLAVGIAIPGIGREDVLSRLFPLPPLSEQHRIVAKVDQLMTLCDALEQQIDATTQKQTALLSAVTAKL